MYLCFYNITQSCHLDFMSSNYFTDVISSRLTFRELGIIETNS